MLKSTAQDARVTSKGLKFESALALCGSAMLLLTVVVLIDQPPINERTDFSVTYVGSRIVHLGLGSKLYDLSEQQKIKKSLLPDAEPLIFEHPPFEALLLAPLGALSYKTAYLIWGVFNIAIWLSLPYLMRGYFPAPRDNLGYLFLWLLFLPLGAALFEGQSSLVMLLIYSITFVQLKSGGDFRAGAVFGLALFKFQFAIPFALILLLQKKWHFIKGFLATGSTLGVLSLLAVGWRGCLSYIQLLTGIASNPENASYGSAIGMATVGGFVSPLLGKVLGHTTASLIVAAVSIGLIVVTAWLWGDGRLADSRKFDLMFSAAVVVSLATSLHMFTPDLSPMLLAMLLVMRYFPARERGILRVVLATTLVIFWMPPFYFLLLTHHWFYLFFPVLMVFLSGIFKLARVTSKENASTTSAGASLAGV